MRCYIFDIDGTLANNEHRRHHIEGESKDWETYHSLCHLDPPIAHIVELAQILQQDYLTGGIIFVSARGEECRKQTEAWLNEHLGFFPTLYMRPAKDHRPDYQIKSEILDKIIAEGYQPIMAFDDRNQVVDMWRSRGIPCAQVAPGDF